MFWRNPSAAFFNFVLPLLFLVAGGAILHGNQSQLNKLVPAIAGMSVMSTTFTALGLQHRVPARARRAQAHPRHPAADRLLPRRRGRERGHEHSAADRDRRDRRPGVFGIGWPKDWAELIVFVLAGVVCLAVAGRGLRPRHPQLRVHRRLRQRRVPAGRVRVLLRLRHRGRAGIHPQRRRRAAAEAADRRAVRGDGDGERA